MNKSRNRCFSARKLPSNQGSPEKLDPLITSKQLSLSFYNATTKKCKKQVMYDWQNALDQSIQSYTDKKLKTEKSKPRSSSIKQQLKKSKNPLNVHKQISRTRSSVTKKSNKINQIQIKNLLISNYFNSPYLKYKASSSTVLKNKSSIRIIKQKNLQQAQQVIDKLKEYLRKV